MGLDLRELLLHRGDGEPCVGAHAGYSRSRKGSTDLLSLCSAERHQYRHAIAERRTHLDGLGRLRRGGLSRLGLSFHNHSSSVEKGRKVKIRCTYGGM
jgi:hypothetical protein